MDEMLQTVAAGMTTLLATILTGLLAWGSRSIKQWLDGKAHAASFQCATQKLEQLAADAVAEVEATLVRQFKQVNQWNADTAREARDAAVRTVKAHLGAKGLKELTSCLGLSALELTGVIRSKVENRVRLNGSSEVKVRPIANL